MAEQQKDLIALLSEIVAGLNVPASIGGPKMLGAAYAPWAAVRDRLHLFGYSNAESVESALREALQEVPSG